MINVPIIIRILGNLLMILGIFMLSALPFSYYYDSGDSHAFILAGTTTFLAGFVSWFSSRKSDKNIYKREGFLIVSLGWIMIAIFSALPYIFFGVFDNYTCPFFESVSGLTTTGASVMTDIESMPKGILFWRSLTQWIGGMGIIVLTVAILPLLGIGGVELFVAEAPGPTSTKIHPRIKDTAKKLWFIYLGLTTILTVILYYNGMDFFDAINHALTTMATGGFSTKNESIAFFNSPTIEYIIACFMFIAGINYTITYFIITGKLGKAFNSDEFKTYIIVVFLISSIVAVVLFNKLGMSSTEAIRKSMFQVISIMTTTGYVSADYTAWLPVITIFFFILLFSGACAGSTSGGIKIIRHLVLVKNAFMELKRLLHPQAIVRLKVDRQIVGNRVLSHILVFFVFYLFLFALGSVLMAIILSDFEQPLITSIGAVATSLGNVGPAIGELGPAHNFAEIPFAGKWLLMLLMLLGRLELFTILILFTFSFWKKN